MHSFDPTVFLKNTTASLCFLQTLYLNYNIELIDFLEQLEEILDELRLPVSRLFTIKLDLETIFSQIKRELGRTSLCMQALFIEFFL